MCIRDRANIVDNTEVEETNDDVIDVVDEENCDELRILGVDDNATNRRVLDMVLRPVGVNLTLCENGLEAFETYKAVSYTHLDVYKRQLNKHYNRHYRRSETSP